MLSRVDADKRCELFGFLKVGGVADEGQDLSNGCLPDAGNRGEQFALLS